MELIYFEDIELNEKGVMGQHFVDKEELIEFSKKWDPRPFHIDEEAAKSLPSGDIIAPGIYTIGIINRLSVQGDSMIVAIGGNAWDEVRFHHPIYPGDTITVTEECIEKRESDSRPDAGIVTSLLEVRNQKDVLCFSFKITFLAAKRLVS